MLTATYRIKLSTKLHRKLICIDFKDVRDIIPGFFTVR